MADRPSGEDSNPASPRSKQEHQAKTLNLLLARVKEKLAALQVEYDKQTKQLTDLTASHTKLINQHSKLSTNHRQMEETLTAKLSASEAKGKADCDALNAKMAKLKSDAQRAQSVLQSELQDEICTLQSSLQSTQSSLQSSQHSLESERVRLSALLTQTKTELRDASGQAEATLLELRKEREDRMRAQFALGDLTKDRDAHIAARKKLDEKVAELADVTVVCKQNVAKMEQQSETWRQKYVHMVKQKAEQKVHLRQYQLLLKYSAVSTYASSFRMKKLMAAVLERVVQLCAEAITQPDAATGGVASISRPNRPPQTAPAGGRERAGASAEARSSDDDRSASPAAARKVSPSRRSSSMRGSVELPTTTTASMDGGHSPTLSSVVAAAGQLPPTSGSRRSQHGGSAFRGLAGAVAGGAGAPSLTGNMGALPRYSVGPIALTDREWEIHVADLAKRTDLAAGHMGGKVTNFHFLQTIEDKLAILTPVVRELRGEVLASRSTSEGMFQRTLQLSRKNMQALARLEREKTRTDALRLKLAIVQREVKKLKRIEYMYNRLTEKDPRAGGANSAPTGGTSASAGGGPMVTGSQQQHMRDMLDLERAEAIRTGGARGRRKADSEAAALAAAAAAAGGRDSPEFDMASSSKDASDEKEISAAILAGAMDDDAYLDSSDDDDDPILGGMEHVTLTSAPMRSPTAAAAAARSNRKPTSASSSRHGGAPTRTKSFPVTLPMTSMATPLSSSHSGAPTPTGGAASSSSSSVYPSGTLSWKAPAKSSIRETILPSNSPSVAGPTTTTTTGGQRSPTRPSAMRLPPAVKGTTTKGPLSPTSVGWAGIPSPPATGSTLGGGSSSARGSVARPRAVYVGTGSGRGGETVRDREAADEKYSEEVDYGLDADADDSARASTGGPVRRTRNPYTISASKPADGSGGASAGVSSKRSSRGSYTPIRPTSPTRLKPTAGGGGQMHTLSRPSTTSSAAPRMHQLNHPHANQPPPVSAAPAAAPAAAPSTDAEGPPSAADAPVAPAATVAEAL